MALKPLLLQEWANCAMGICCARTWVEERVEPFLGDPDRVRVTSRRRRSTIWQTEDEESDAETVDEAEASLRCCSSCCVICTGFVSGFWKPASAPRRHLSRRLRRRLANIINGVGRCFWVNPRVGCCCCSPARADHQYLGKLRSHHHQHRRRAFYGRIEA